ncbi:hypothetical protein HDF18_21150 [Mucilaginibacter sp. X5P1]|uniref:hypothetical protein n=1 Tax=Mucilaginibacter sp. X5P1 TaxID=2723088 RepID=UPI0016230BAC|nr:hypothetical protein [Mucilaginibacter sp. X5P1]MBB6140118.1 hypothetical protein [Mucilaginibacter sp. X5P1]
MSAGKYDLKQYKSSARLPDMRSVFFQPRLTVNQPNDVYEQEAEHMADKVMRMPSSPINTGGFFKPANNIIQRMPATIQRKMEMTGNDAAHCMQKAEETLKKLETNMQGNSYGKQDYITGAVKMLRSKWDAKKIKCYHFDGMVHGEDDYSGDEIWLDGDNDNFLDEGTLLHEGVHAYQASQHKDIAAKYADALNTQRPLDPAKPADLKLLKWKAWTEYWAYRAKYDYFNPTLKQAAKEEDIDKWTMDTPDVHKSTARVWLGDQSFIPKAYDPKIDK